MVRRLFITFGLVIVFIAYQSTVQAVWAEQEQAQFQSEQEIIGGSKLQLMPLLLQEKENQCTGLKKFLNDLLGIFACDSEQYQNITMPSQLAIQGEAGESVKGVATATSEGQVRGITTIISDIASLLGFTSKALSGPNEGALLKYFPNSFKDTLTQSGNPNADIKKAVKEGQCMNMPLALQQGCGAQQGTAYYIPPADTVPALPVPTFAPISGAQTATARSVRQLAKLAGDWAGVPWQIVEAMLIVEGSSYRQGVDLNTIASGVFALSPTELAAYQQPNAVASLLCSPNACSAAGVMQMTTAGCVPFDTCEVKRNDTTNVNCASCTPACTYKPSAWSGYKNAVLEAQNDGRTPNICNIKDSVFAGAKKMKADSGTAFGVLADWDYTTVTRVTNSYYGSCIRCGAAASNPGARYACERLGKTYCDFVWDYYQQRKNDVVEPIAQISPEQPNQALQGRYAMNYQTGDPYGSVPLPGNTSYTVTNAGCGPMTAFNALSNFNPGFNTGFRDFLYGYYPNADENGTSIDEGRTILGQFGFSTEYIYLWYYAEGTTVELNELTSDFSNYLNNGWQGIWVNALLWSPRRDAWSGHHLLVVEVNGTDVYALDPYYGYDNPIPMRLNDLHPKIRNAFVFRKL